MSKLVLVDGNNRSWASFYAYNKLSYKGQRVGMIYGFPSMIKALYRKLNPDKLIIVWDGRRSKHRLEAFPAYKSGRKLILDYDSWVYQKKVVQTTMTLLGVSQVLSPNNEADDIIYKLARNSTKKYNKVVIVSGDKDFNQLINARISVFSETKKQFITERNCFELFGYHPENCVDYLSLAGDGSDNIPGYPGMGPKKTAQFIKTYRSLATYFAEKHNDPKLDNDLLLEAWKNGEKLIDLEYYYQLYKKELILEWIGGKMNPKKNPDKFRKLMGKYGIKKLITKEFVNGFR